MVLIFSIFIYLIKYIVISLYYSTRDIYISSYIILHNNNNIFEMMNPFLHSLRHLPLFFICYLSWDDIYHYYFLLQFWEYGLHVSLFTLLRFYAWWTWLLSMVIELRKIRFIVLFICEGLLLMYYQFNLNIWI